MGAASPVEVGTRGTVASLVMKEIEYFRSLEVDLKKPQEHTEDAGVASSSASSSRRSSSSGSSSNFLPSFGFLVMTWRRKKKRRGSGGFVPSMCSAVEVDQANELKGIPGFNYRNLKADVKKYDQF